MLLDMCGCSSEEGGRRGVGVGAGVVAVVVKAGVAGLGGGQAGEVCARLHYPADLVMTAGAQEERSGRG